MDPHVAAVKALTVNDAAILQLIAKFANDVERASEREASWPYAAVCSLADVKLLLVQMVTVTGSRPLPAATTSVIAPLTLRPFVHGPAHWCQPVRRHDWQHFRYVAEPAIRRAALWAVAWLVVPGLDRRFFPGWVGRRGINDGRPFVGEPSSIGRAA